MIFLSIVGFGLFVGLMIILLKLWLDFTFKRDWWAAWMVGAFIIISAGAGAVVQLVATLIAHATKP